VVLSASILTTIALSIGSKSRDREGSLPVSKSEGEVGLTYLPARPLSGGLLRLCLRAVELARCRDRGRNVVSKSRESLRVHVKIQGPCRRIHVGLAEDCW
jgi:hypothetical protein